MRAREAAARLFVYDGRALYMGPVSDPEPHAHRSVQVCIALRGRFGLRTASRNEWRRYRAAVVGADRPHQIEGHGTPLAVLYLDPAALASRAFARPAHDSGVCPVPRFALRRMLGIVAALRPETDPDAIRRLVDLWARTIAPGCFPDAPIDPRVRKALDHLRSDLADPPTVAEISTAVGMSAESLRKLFRSDTGLPPRRHAAWARLATAVDRIRVGAPLSEAAREAGYSDPTHFGRSLTRVLGLPLASAR